jgi:signal transduction histidine kinase
MADVAASVLHNVGNVLNSVNTSAGLAISAIRHSFSEDVGRIAALLQEHASALGDYLTSDPKGKQIPSYLVGLADHLAQERAGILEELNSLSSKIEHIRHIISRQQDFTTVGGLQALENLAQLMEEALSINFASLERHSIEVIREYAEIPQIELDRHLVLQILVNLISNAKYAMLQLEGRLHRLTLRVGMAEDRQGFVRLQVQDTDVGIKREHQSRIFAQGFTTKTDGHGLGLHSGALAARVLAGSRSFHSDGEGQGATFTLDLPLKPVEDRV